jgi:glycolate oxidase FAD binding subunit
MRDLVIGVTVVLPDGTRASSGGKVVKNVAGYDLGKLFCGSRGRLGRVERLGLRLHPLPEATATVAADPDWPRLHRAQLVPSAVDIAGGQMYVLFEGTERAVTTQAHVLGGEQVEPWAELRALQASLPGRVRWRGEEAPLVRPGRGIAHTAEATGSAWSPLAERVREALCSPS